MGESPKPRTFRLTDETIRKLDQMQIAFAPMPRNRTDMLNIVIDLFHSIIFGEGILERLSGVLQGLHRSALQYEFPREGKPGPARIAEVGSPDSRRSGVLGTTHRRTGRATVVLGSKIYPFCASFRLGFKSAQQGIVS
jgi:hypothetical protein